MNASAEDAKRARRADAVRMLQSGRPDEAERLLAPLLAGPAVDAESLHLMGVIRLSTGATGDALDCFRRATDAQPGHAAAHYNLGKALLETGSVTEGVEATRRATALRPDFAMAWNNLGNGLTTLGEWAEAIEAFERALTLQPGNAAYWTNSAKAHRLSGDIGRALQAAERATSLAPDHAEAWLNLAAAHLAAGAPEASRSAAERAAACATAEGDPRGARARSLAAGLANYIETDPAKIAKAYKRWAETDADPHTPTAPEPDDRNPDRALTIGYVSPDFRRHSVSHFLTALFGGHDKTAVRVVGFSDAARPDDVTARLRGAADRWIDLTGHDDRQAFDLIRAERVDILVDLAGPTLGNRLGVFARRPAPVQVSWLGFPGSTGMRALDWRIADDRAAPENEDALYPDHVWRLQNGYHCFEPLDDARPGSIDPDRPVTLGCFNHIAKLSASLLDAWAAILQASGDARLLLKSDGLDDPQVARALSDRLTGAGIDPSRVDLEGRLAEAGAHLGRYDAIDVALDAFPYNGTTTTCEALWMGAPVICLDGGAPAGRVGASLMASAGLTDYVADTLEGYVGLAIEAAARGVRRRDARLALREAVQSSPLCDGPSFAAKMERAYRGMWRARLGLDP